MSIPAGTLLGPFEIVAPIGAGGMGEVFKARDTRLGRTVALKVLPAEFQRDAGRLARFQREAEAISRLNHPNICTLYDVGSEEGIDYLVMEYIEGHSLADRLEKGPLSQDEMLRIGAEIAEALQRAHKQGIVHRDLKPSNIMLTGSGVKLLDFGLAKSRNASASVTAEGAVVGTFKYMAPEQLEGRPADERSDIYSLGVILNEMARHPGGAEELDHLIRKCIENAPDERWQSAWDIAEQLRWIGQSAKRPAPPGKQKFTVAAGIVFLAIAATGATLWLRRGTQFEQPVRLHLTSPGRGWVIGSPTQRPFAISPDGQHVALMTHGKAVALWVRDLSSETFERIEAKGVIRHPFWSFDGKSLGFFVDGVIKRVALNGAAPQTVCAAAADFGASWGPDGVIIFANRSGIHSVSAAGGKPVRIIPPIPRYVYVDPVFLPDGNRFLLTQFDVTERTAAVMVTSLREPAVRKVISADAANATWISSGHLLFVRGEKLMAQRFDVGSAVVSGRPVVIAPKVGAIRRETMNALYSVSRSGDVLALQPSLSHDTRLVHANPDGDTVAELAGPARIWSPRLSPDLSRVAFMIEEPNGNADIWMLSLDRRVMMRVTTELSHDGSPVWSPDGRWIAYSSDDGIYRVPSEGGTRELLVRGSFQKSVTDWSADGQTIVFTSYDDPTSSNINAFRFSDRSVTPVVATPFAENFGRLSPDGEWLAYQSNETGANQVYVQRFRDGAMKTAVSGNGGSQPKWLRDGKRIEFSPFMMAEIRLDHGVQVTPARPLLRRRITLNDYEYDVFPDGSGVIGRRHDEDWTQGLQIEFLVNWTGRLP